VIRAPAAIGLRRVRSERKRAIAPMVRGGPRTFGAGRCARLRVARSAPRSWPGSRCAAPSANPSGTASSRGPLQRGVFHL